MAIQIANFLKFYNMGNAASIATSALGTGYSIYSAFESNSRKKSAQNALNNLKSPELTNAFKDQQVSTLGSDLRRQEAGRNTASSIDALKGGGARAIIGGIGQVQANNNQVNAEIGANLDQQQKDINMNKAQDDINIRNIKENRYNNDVNSLSSQINSASDSENQSIANAFQGIGNISNSIGSKKKDYSKVFGNPKQFSDSIK